jgi:acetyl esterase/lipase
VRTLLFWLAAVLAAAQAHAASYGPYPEETYHACGAATSPVAVEIIHGGAWASGYAVEPQSFSLCQYLGANGIYAVTINYRLTHTASWPAQLQDTQLALRWLRTHSAAQRVGVIGLSAGGQIALLMGETPAPTQFAATDPDGEAKLLTSVSDIPDFVVDISGPTDLTDPGLLPGNVRLLIQGIQMSTEAARGFASPIVHLTANMPPLLISHGRQDHTVPSSQSDAFIRAATQAGISVKGVDAGSAHAVAALSGITYDKHSGGHVFDVSSAVQASLFRMIALFAKALT